jgi:hypothetical protein
MDRNRQFKVAQEHATREVRGNPSQHAVPPQFRPRPTDATANLLGMGCIDNQFGTEQLEVEPAAPPDRQVGLAMPAVRFATLRAATKKLGL